MSAESDGDSSHGCGRYMGSIKSRVLGQRWGKFGGGKRGNRGTPGNFLPHCVANTHASHSAYFWVFRVEFFPLPTTPDFFLLFFCFSKWKTFLLSFCWQLFCAATTEQGKFLKWLNWIGLDKFAARKTLNLQWLKAPPLLSRFCTCKWTAVGSQSGDVTIESYL